MRGDRQVLIEGPNYPHATTFQLNWHFKYVKPILLAQTLFLFIRFADIGFQPELIRPAIWDWERRGWLYDRRGSWVTFHRAGLQILHRADWLRAGLLRGWLGRRQRQGDLAQRPCWEE
jgi:hypothetical protein